MRNQFVLKRTRISPKDMLKVLVTYGGILLICLLVRLVWVFFIAPNIPNALGSTSGHPSLKMSSDFFYHYNPVAQNIFEGRGFLDRDGYPTAHVPPLYPFFLSLIYSLFGQSPSTIRLVQIFMDSFSCLLTIIIAGNIFGRKTGVLSGVLYAFSPLLFYQTGLLGAETLFTFLFLCSIYFLVRTFDSPYYNDVFLSGLLMGFATLCREVPLMLPLFILVGLLYSFRSRIKLAFKKFVLLVFAMSLVVMPWIMRNYIVFKEFMPFRTSFSHAKYLFEKAESNVRQTEFQGWIVKKRNAILHNPLAFVKKTGVSFYQMWFVTDSGNWQKQLMLLQFSTLLLAIIGILISRKLRNKDLPLLLVIIYWVLVIAIMIGRGLVRYIIPIMPLILMYASCAMVWFFEKISRSRLNFDLVVGRSGEFR